MIPRKRKEPKMTGKGIDRREFIKSVLAGIPLVALDWDSLARGDESTRSGSGFDVAVIGSGLGGLSCAAAFARQGFKPVVLEQHYVPGGYATTFKRRDFVFDVSLHSTSVPERDGIHNMIPGFPEITDVMFEPHPDLYRVIYPDYDLRVPQKNIPAYTARLAKDFPAAKEGIDALIGDMRGLSGDVQKYVAYRGEADDTAFPEKYPYLAGLYDKTWGDMVDARITDPKLKSVLSALWGYYGLPPSRLASMYYALPTYQYLSEGGYYPRGKSQKISDALVEYIKSRGGEVRLKTRVEGIVTEGGKAVGVKTAGGDAIRSRVVVSNASAHDTFNKFLKKEDYMTEYLNRLDGLSVSVSCFQVFLGLKKDLVGELGIKDSEIFCADTYDIDASYKLALDADVTNGDLGITLYDNIYEGYSPAGKNTINLLALQGYDFWEKYEHDYFHGDTAAYRKEKEKMADVIIERAEQKLLPGLREAVEVMEIGTPLTNLRYTSNHRGAMYGFDQTLDNSGPSRLPHKTPLDNLYLAGAWTSPGHGYGGVLWGGLACFGEIIKGWE